MTFSDLYAVVCFGAAVGLIGLTIGYAVDNWRDWQQAR